jgi:hypothetical protein
MANATLRYQEFRSQESGVRSSEFRSQGEEGRRKKEGRRKEKECCKAFELIFGLHSSKYRHNIGKISNGNGNDK